MEEIENFEIKKIKEKGDEDDEEGDIKEKKETRDVLTHRELIFVTNYKKFIEYMGNITREDFKSPANNFINSVIGYFIEGLKKDYVINDPNNPDNRFLELMGSVRDFEKEIDRFDGYYREAVIFPKMRELRGYLKAAREGHLAEFRKEQENK